MTTDTAVRVTRMVVQEKGDLTSCLVRYLNLTVDSLSGTNPVY